MWGGGNENSQEVPETRALKVWMDLTTSIVAQRLLAAEWAQALAPERWPA